MNTEHKSFVMYKEWYDIIKRLSTESKAILLDAVFVYNITGEVMPMPRELDLAFHFMRQTFDRDNAKWQEIRNKRSQAGKKSASQRYKAED